MRNESKSWDNPVYRIIPNPVDTIASPKKAMYCRVLSKIYLFIIEYYLKKIMSTGGTEFPPNITPSIVIVLY
jgi:hypothetical protein